MATSTVSDPGRRADPVRRRSRPGPGRLGVSARRSVVAIHIVAAGSWIGIDVLVAVLVATGWFSDDPATRATAYQALGRFTVTPMLVTALVCTASGVVLALGTKWGLVRYWWVLVKLVISLVLCTLIVVALRPGMDEVTAAGELIARNRVPDADLGTLFFPPVVSLSALCGAVLLSVFKPWNRIRRQR